MVEMTIPNDNLERMWKRAGVAHLQVQFHNLLIRDRNIKKKITHPKPVHGLILGIQNKRQECKQLNRSVKFFSIQTVRVGVRADT
jgi:hypothetical protein